MRGALVAERGFRLRIAYAKSGRLRWLSHLEVVRALERGIRRAGLSYVVTQGFSPHMKIAFGPALPVGTGGNREYVDVWLREYVPAGEALGRLKGALPHGLQPAQARYVSDQLPSLTAGTLVGEYDVRVEGEEVGSERVQAALDALMESGELVVEHKGKTKVFDLARSIPKEPRVSDEDGCVRVALTVRMGPQGSLRPDVLLRASFDAASLRVAVTEVTRTDTFIETEEGVWSRPA